MRNFWRTGLARSLLSFGQVSLPEAAPCTVQRQKPYPAYLFRVRRRRSLRGPTHRPETMISRRWSTATRQQTPVTIARRRKPPRNAAPTTLLPPPRTTDDRGTVRRATGPQETIQTIVTPQPDAPPTPMLTPKPALTPTQPSAPARNPAPRKRTTRNRPRSRLPTTPLREIPHPIRQPWFNRPKRPRRRRTRSPLRFPSPLHR